jgi:hypothetical protein
VFSTHRDWLYRTFTDLAARSNFPFASKEVVKEWIFTHDFGVYIKSEYFDKRGKFNPNQRNRWARPEEQERVER